MKSQAMIQLDHEWRLYKQQARKEDMAMARQLWDLGDRAMARDVLRSVDAPTPEQLGWPRNAPGPATARQMHPDVARALGIVPDAPEAIAAPMEGTRKIKPGKWRAARWVPLVGLVHERKGTRA